MEQLHVLRDLAVIFAGSLLVILVFYRFKLPALPGFIVAGILLGPNALGLVPDVRRIPSRWRAGDVVLLASVPFGDLKAEAELVRLLRTVAPLLTLAHDVGVAGLEAALEEAAEWSGRSARVEAVEEPQRTTAILACAPADVDALGSRGLTRIGEVL